MKTYLIILLLILPACDLLDTRDPETPNTGGSSFVAPTSENILFKNFIESFRDKNLENYLSCFVDPTYTNKQFKFIPSAGSISQFDDLANWDLNAERTYFNNLRTIPGDGVPITLTLNNQVNTPLGDSAVYQFDYSLNVPVTGDQSASNYRGSVIFRIYRDNRLQWAIGEWEDIKLDNFVSWSELKGRYY